MSQMKAQLYNDLHPDKSLKNTGFKDLSTAIKTIKMVEKRSLRYQFDVINTMYNRAKYHPHINDDMKKAMGVFKKWLKNYSKMKTMEDKKYPWLSLKTISKYSRLCKSLICVGKNFNSQSDKSSVFNSLKLSNWFFNSSNLLQNIV